MPHSPPSHRPRGPEQRRDLRPGSAARGYDFNWQKLRQAHLYEHPLCADCEAEGRCTPAVHVHHVRPIRERPDLRLDGQNLLSLCAQCHNRRTARGG